MEEDYRVKSICPYADLLRWRRRFWWSFALNVGFGLWLAWRG